MPGSGNSSISAQDGPQETIILPDKLRIIPEREIWGEVVDGEFGLQIQSIALVTFYFHDYVVVL